MIDLTQIKSSYNKRNMKDDIEYIKELSNLTVYEDGYDLKEKDKFDFTKETKELEKLKHIHNELDNLNSISDDDIKKWNLKLNSIKRNTSMYLNDTNFISKEKAASIINSLNLKASYYQFDEIIINSLTGKKVKVKVDDHGALIVDEITFQ